MATRLGLPRMCHKFALPRVLCKRQVGIHILSSMRLALALIASFASTSALAQTAPLCSTLRSEVTLSSLSGHRIDSVFVETAQPSLGRLSHLVGRLHVRTRPEVIRRELLFAPGDTVDTLQIAESLRRLRQLGFLEHSHVEARRCVTESGELLALKVVTRDSWTTRPDLKASSTGPRIGITERDLFGTGRTVSLNLVSRNGSLGAGITTSDAFGFGTGTTTRAQYQQYSDGSVRALSLARRQASLTDHWRAQLEFSDQRHESKSLLGDDFERTRGELIGGIRVSPRRVSNALYLLAGAESEFSSLRSAIGAQVVGPVRIDRRFSGPQLGIALVSTRYDTLTWLMPRGSVVDVPRALEGELVVGFGKGAVASWDGAGPPEINRTNFMTHYDGWLGREWLPTRTSRVVGDVWASGYSRSGAWQSARLRAALSAEHETSNGVLRLTAAAEQLRDPDPDVRALSIADRALAFVPRRVRFAESGLTMSLERTRHLVPIGSSLELDASIFGAYSKRWNPAASAPAAGDFSVGVVGLGLALSPLRPGRASVRLDYGIPLFTPPGVKRAPRLSITLMPWLEASRHRDKSGAF